MTTGPLALSAPVGSLAAPLRRPAALTALLVAAILVAGAVPGLVGHTLLLLLTLGGIAGASLATVHAASDSVRPAVWRWYAGTTIAALLGSATVQLVAGDAVPPTFGALPGMLLALVPLGLLIPRGTWAGVRAQLVSSLSLFVIACLLCLLTLFILVTGGGIDVGTMRGVTLYALGSTLALTTGASLLVVTSSAGPQRRTALLALAGQLANALASALGALLPVLSPDSQTPHPVTSVAGVLGAGFLLLAARSDRAPLPERGSDALRSPLSALLPHLTALAGGSLLLLTVVSTGTVDRVGLSLGVLGLVLLVVHQAVSWRDQQALTDRLQRSEAYFRTLVRSSVDPVVILDDRLRVTWSSSALTDLLGLDPGRTVGQELTATVHPDDAPGLVTALSATDRDETAEGRTRTARLRHTDGGWRLIQVRIRDLREDPDVGALVLHCRDVTREAVTPDDTDRPLVATTDPVTGLPNRAALVQRLAHLLRAPGTANSLVMVGLTGLPDGSAGDEAPPAVLVELAGRFSRVLRGDDWLVRSGPAEFAVVVTGSVADAETVANRLTATVDADHPVAGLRVSASAGVIPLDGDTDAGEALRRADVAMVSARAAGPGRVRRHSVALLIAQNRRDALRHDLAGALDRDELRLVYQPVVDLALHRTGSVEALLRWQHPTWGAVSPAEFVPLAEESSLVVTLGRWVLRTATATVAALPGSSLAVAVNVSARHVRSGELLTDVLDALAASGLPASRLTLELTESVLLDATHVTDELLALRRLGVRIAVDDFGTGWSSLAYLVGLPIDVLKMDRQFLAQIEVDPQRRALCRSVLHLGSSLGMDVVVEGVETTAELQLLRDMGHRFVQGFLLARPIEAADLTARLDGVLALPGGSPS
ncbi:bifunctional diguanylate cyclase/phosphodiesterase [Modestobacter sp. Leaf380]|uniref:putative bifunctional diguanylate cyclase/phosphodiesterase n=1 Tax=Modestobacter sp. Leaf380 TaxID=1736356 RepID=UPI0006F59B4E|nr:EAL domain-containing protein [Modestobacter sp. Leaf380]KQS68858.1 hypothetical protein ASG41_08105 [Modestobacter sp. Leaf380]